MSAKNIKDARCRLSAVKQSSTVIVLDSRVAVTGTGVLRK